MSSSSLKEGGEGIKVEPEIYERGCQKSEKSGDVIYDAPFYIGTAWLRDSATSFAPPQLDVCKSTSD